MRPDLIVIAYNFWGLTLRLTLDAQERKHEWRGQIWTQKQRKRERENINREAKSEHRNNVRENIGGEANLNIETEKKKQEKLGSLKYIKIKEKEKDKQLKTHKGKEIKESRVETQKKGKWKT